MKSPSEATADVQVRVKPRSLAPPYFRLENKIAVITGGGSGIGRAIAECFAASGAVIRILDVDQAAALEVAGGIASNGGKAAAHPCDIADHEAVHRAFQQLGRDERIDILVNDAGIAHIGTLENTSQAVELQPDIIVNNRNDLPGDFGTLTNSVRQEANGERNARTIRSAAGAV